MTFLYSFQEFWAITHLSCFSWWFDMVAGSLGTTGFGSLRTAQFGSLRTVLESSSSSSASSSSPPASSSPPPPSSSWSSCPLNSPHVPAPCSHLSPKPTPCPSPVSPSVTLKVSFHHVGPLNPPHVPAPCPHLSPKPTPCPSPVSPSVTLKVSFHHAAPLPLWKIMDFVSWDDDIPNWMEKNVTNHQSGENFRAKLDFEPAWIGFYPSNIDLKIPGLPMINPLKIPIVDG